MTPLKVISVWNPYAMLLVHGIKFNETRGWPAPPLLIGQRIGIASTKIIKPDQRRAYADPVFQKFYAATGLPPLEELPNGYLLGTVQLHSCEMITDEDFGDITEEEKAFGWYEKGRWAWRMRYPHLLPVPLKVRGGQGVWKWDPIDQLMSTNIAG